MIHVNRAQSKSDYQTRDNIAAVSIAITDESLAGTGKNTNEVKNFKNNPTLNIVQK